MTEVRRGDVVLVRLDPAEGSEIRKTRPAVVVSNRAACHFDAVVQVVPLTGIPERDLRPYEARVDSPSSAVTKPSRAVANQIRTIARQCYAWALPYGVSLEEKVDVKDGKIASDAFEGRLSMFVRDVQVYGSLLASQRTADLAGSDPGFLAKHRG